MSKDNKRSLCNQDCNNCEAIKNEQLAVLLNVLTFVVHSILALEAPVQETPPAAPSPSPEIRSCS